MAKIIMSKIGIGYLLFLFQLLFISVHGITCTFSKNAFTVYIQSSFKLVTNPNTSVTAKITMASGGTGTFTGSTTITSDSNGDAIFYGYFNQLGTFDLEINCDTTSIATKHITTLNPVIKTSSVPSTVIKNEAFTMVLKVQDSYGVIDSGTNSDFTIKVSGSDINAITGVKSGGLYTFTGLMISLASNSFEIPYTLTDPGSLLSVTGTQKIKVISADKFLVGSVPLYYRTFFTKTFTVSLTDSSGLVYYTTESTVILTESTSNIQGGGHLTSSTGKFTYTVHYKIKITSTTMTFSFNSISEKVDVVIYKSVLKIIVTPSSPTLSTTSISVDIYVYNKDDGSTDNYIGTNKITLSIVPTTTGNSGTKLSGIISADTDTSAYAQFTSLYVLSSGTFTIHASSPEIAAVDSSEFTIDNLIKDITISYNGNTIYSWLNFIATVELIGEDDKKFLLSTTVTISELTGTLKGLSPLPNNAGIIAFENIYFSNYGKFEIEVETSSSKLKKKFNVEVIASIIDLSFLTNPKDSQTPFSLIATTKSYAEGTTISTNEPFIIALTLTKYETGQSGLVWTYKDSKSTASGTTTFNDLQVLSSGDFYIVATSSGFSDGETSVFEITNHVKTVTASSIVTNSDIFMPVTLTYSLKGDDDNDFILPATVSVELPSLTDMTSTTSSVITTGSVTVTSSSVGEYSFQLITTSSTVKSLPVSITFLDPNLVLTLSVTPELSITSFNIDVCLKNNANNAVLTNSGTLTVNLGIACTNSFTCSGLVTDPILSTLNLKSGYGTLTSVKILSSGTFDLSATYLTWTPIKATTGKITNLISTLTFIIVSPLYTYVDFDVSIALTGEDNAPFILECTLTLSDDSNGKFLGEKTIKSSDSTKKFTNMHYNGAGTFSIKGTVTEYPIYDSSSVTIIESALKLSLSPTPSDSSIPFTSTVTAKQTIGGATIISNNPFKIALTLTKSETGQSGIVWTYTSTEDTTLGVAIFKDLYIKSSGSFYIVASSSGFSNIQSSIFTIKNHVKAVTASSIITNSDIFMPVTLTYSLKGDDDNDFILPATVSIELPSLTDMTSTTSSDITTGSVTVTSSSVGEYSFQLITTSSTVKSLPVSITFLDPNLVLTLSVTPELSITSFNIDVCLKNNANNAVLTNSGTLTLNLAIACTNSFTCSGFITDPILSTLTLKSGYGTLTSVKILSSGTFDLSATYLTWTPIKATTGKITNLISALAFTIVSPLYSYVDFDVSIALTGEDNAPFILECTLTLSDDSNGKFLGEKTIKSSDPTKKFTNMHYNGAGTFSIKGTVTEYPIYDSTSVIINDSFLELSLSPTPSDSYEPFSLTVTAKKVSDRTTITSNGPFLIGLTLTKSESGQSGTVWTYISSQDTISGVAKFSDLYIKSSGEFIIVASSSGFTDAKSSVFTIKNHVKEIISAFYGTNSDIFTPTPIFYSLKGDDDNDFILPTTISVEVSPSTDITSTSSSDITKGSVTVTSSSVGEYSFQLTTTSSSFKSLSILITFLVPSLDLTFSVTPKLSTTPFEIIADLKNNANNVILTNSGTLTADLALVCANGYTCSGLMTTPTFSTITLTSGHGTLPSMNILSSGTFTFKATIIGFTDYFSDTFTVSNLVITMEIIPSLVIISAYQYFTITILLTGEDGQKYLSQATVSLSTDHHDITFEDQTDSVSQYNWDKIIVKKSGPIIFSTLVGIESQHSKFSNPDFSIDILEYKLVISPSIISEDTSKRRLSNVINYYDPINSYEEFSLVVVVYDNLLEEILYGAYGLEYTFKISCTDGEKCSGTELEIENDPWTRSIGSEGYYDYSNTRFLSAGYFTLKATTDDMVEGYYYTKFITNYVKSFGVEISNKTPSINFDFQTSVKIYGDDGKIYMLPAVVYIGTNGVAIYAESYEVVTYNSKADFVTWISYPGSTAIVISTNTSEIQSSTSIEVLKNVIKI